MSELIEEFLAYLKYERYRSDCTITSYGLDLKDFVVFVDSIDEGLTWATVDSDIVRNWVEMMIDRGNTATSVNRRLSSLRSFYKFAMARGKVSVDPSHSVKGPKKQRLLPSFLREEEMDRLLDTLPWSDDYDDVLLRTIILVFYSTGIRLSELVALDDGSVDYVSGNIRVRGKRNKDRVVPFGSELADALKSYQQLRDAEKTRTDGALFVDSRGHRVKPYFVRTIVTRGLSRVTSMKKRSPHVLRHTFATAMLNNSSGLENVQKLLGHNSVATTEIYTHTTFEQLRKAYASAHPREHSGNPSPRSEE